MSLVGKAIAAAVVSTALVTMSVSTFAAAPASKPAATPTPTPAPKPPAAVTPAAPVTPAPVISPPAPSTLLQPPTAAAPSASLPDVSEARMVIARQVAKNAPTLGNFDGILPDLMVETKMRLISMRPDLYKQISVVVEAQASALIVRRNDLDNDIARAWARAFTDDELKQINTFFASDVGKKYKSAAPQVGADIIQAGQNWADRLSGEMYDRSMAELTKQGIKF
jgi:hypothetical protein